MAKTAEEQAHDLLLNLWDKSNTHKMQCEIGLKGVQFVNLKCAIISSIKAYAEQEREKAFKEGYEYGLGLSGGSVGVLEIRCMETSYNEYQEQNPLQ